MSALRWLLPAALAPAVAAVSAGELGSVQVHVEGVAAESPVTITATAEGSQPLAGVIAEPNRSCTLRLEAGRLWHVSAEAAGYWGAPEALFVRASAAEALEIRLWPTATVEGRVEVETGEPPPPSLQLRFRRAAGADATGPPDGEVDCGIRGGRFRCDLPCGRWDLRARSRGFVPHYRWGVDVGPLAPSDLGALRMRRGGSVAGFVESQIASVRAGDCVVDLRLPKTDVQRPEEAARAASIVMTTRPNDRGFFQFTGVAPGVYELVAHHPEAALARVFPVRVAEGLESEVGPPLKLSPPATLEVSVEPAQDPWDRWWRIDVVDWRLEEPTLPLASRGLAEGGLYRSEALAPGPYVVQVRDQDGSTWASQRIEVRTASESIWIEIDVVRVRGSVRLGDEPIAAELTFIEQPPTTSEPRGILRSVRGVLADADGEFEGSLPSEGEYRVVVEARDPPLRSTLTGIVVERTSVQRAASVEIVLPNGKLAGLVVDEAGKPVSGVRVKVVSLEIGGWQVLSSDEKGSFEAAGLGAGAYRLDAVLGDLASDPIDIYLGKDESRDELRLILRKQTVLKGRVLDGYGAVPAARVEVITGAEVKHAVTEVDGSFTLRVPANAPAMLPLAVLAPGRSLHLSSLANRTSAEPVLIRLSAIGGTARLLAPEPMRSELLIVIAPRGVSSGWVLDRWATLHGMPMITGSRDAVVPTLEPGPYTVCSVTRDEGLALQPALRIDPFLALTAWASANPRACAGGFLEANAELVLQLPSR